SYPFKSKVQEIIQEGKPEAGPGSTTQAYREEIVLQNGLENN
ncbi:35928_t:CDS:1, partial [Gigaspora margarita]